MCTAGLSINESIWENKSDRFLGQELTLREFANGSQESTFVWFVCDSTQGQIIPVPESTNYIFRT